MFLKSTNLVFLADLLCCLLYLAPWWQVDLGQDVAVQKIVIYNRQDICLNSNICQVRLSNAVVSLLDANGNALWSHQLGDMSSTFKIDLEPYRKKFSIVNPSTRKALSSTADCRVVWQAFEKSKISQQFELTSYDQLESVACPGKVVSASLTSKWDCRKNGLSIGLGDIHWGHTEVDAIRACGELYPAQCRSNGYNVCSATQKESYKCQDGLSLALNTAGSHDESQKWRFYSDGIVNLACGRDNGRLAITEMDFDYDSLLLSNTLIQYSFVNPYNNMAITIGNVVSNSSYIF
jgi:hypothetical protein